MTDKLETTVCEDRFAIIGPYGNIWTWEVFETAEAAEAYLVEFWKPTPKQFERQKWKIAVAQITVKALEPSFPLPSCQPKATT